MCARQFALVFAENSPNPAFESVPLDRITKLTRHHQAEPGLVGRLCSHHNFFKFIFLTMSKNAVEFLFERKPPRSIKPLVQRNQAERTLRPFLRRRAKIARPALELIRALNPCLFFRLRLLTVILIFIIQPILKIASKFNSRRTTMKRTISFSPRPTARP
jgi:hypothetical protein